MKFKTFCLTLSLWVLPQLLLAVEVDTAWVRRYNGPGNYFDCAYDIVVDKQYNVYVTGISVGAGTGNDYLTIKYNSQGDTLWTRRYDSGYGNGIDLANAMALDSPGNVIVTGMSKGPDSSGDYLTIKYNSEGETLWVRRYNGEVGGMDEALAIAVDNSNNVYVTGWSQGLTGDTSYMFGFYDYLTIKYTPAGDTVWARRYNGPGDNCDRAEDIAVDTEGNVIVTGGSAGSDTLWDYATIKYSSLGETLWVRRYDGPQNKGDRAYALAIDNVGNVYVTGGIGGTSNSWDYGTVKYNPQGDTLWTREYDGPVNLSDAGYFIAIDNSDNVYVTGISFDTAEVVYATIKYTPLGDTLWLRKCGVGSAIQGPIGIAVDGMGNVYVTGESGGAAAQKYMTVAYSPAGAELWWQTYELISNSHNRPHAITVDDSGNVYVTGSSEGTGTQYDYATIKYTQTSGVEETVQKEKYNKFYVIKNPTIKEIEISFPFIKERSIMLDLYDISGRFIERLFDGKVKGKLRFSTYNFSSGIYFLVAKIDERKEIQKVVVIK